MVIIFGSLAGGAGYYLMNRTTMPYESVCQKGHKNYSKKCDNVGKRAYSVTNMRYVSPRDYGEILGVAWRRKDSVISPPGHAKRYSEKNAHYYILGESKEADYMYLRRVDEAQALTKDEAKNLNKKYRKKKKSKRKIKKKTRN